MFPLTRRKNVLQALQFHYFKPLPRFAGLFSVEMIFRLFDFFRGLVKETALRIRFSAFHFNVYIFNLFGKID
jgi:hypothetical protein